MSEPGPLEREIREMLMRSRSPAPPPGATAVLYLRDDGHLVVKWSDCVEQDVAQPPPTAQETDPE